MVVVCKEMYACDREMDIVCREMKICCDALSVRGREMDRVKSEMDIATKE